MIDAVEYLKKATARYCLKGTRIIGCGYANAGTFPPRGLIGCEKENKQHYHRFFVVSINLNSWLPKVSFPPCNSNFKPFEELRYFPKNDVCYIILPRRRMEAIIIKHLQQNTV